MRSDLPFAREARSASSIGRVADTKQTKTIGEFAVASELARRGWAPALTRDGLERTDILAVRVDDDADRTMVEVQVKSAMARSARVTWPIGTKAQGPSKSDHEFFVMVAVPIDANARPEFFIVPRIHVAAAAWIEHEDWRTAPGIPAGKRNARADQARTGIETFRAYQDRWDLLERPQSEVPVLLPARFRALALDQRVGLPPGHEWHEVLPPLERWG